MPKGDRCVIHTGEKRGRERGEVAERTGTVGAIIDTHKVLCFDISSCKQNHYYSTQQPPAPK